MCPPPLLLFALLGLTYLSLSATKMTRRSSSSEAKMRMSWRTLRQVKRHSKSTCSSRESVGRRSSSTCRTAMGKMGQGKPGVLLWVLHRVTPCWLPFPPSPPRAPNLASYAVRPILLFPSDHSSVSIVLRHPVVGRRANWECGGGYKGRHSGAGRLSGREES